MSVPYEFEDAIAAFDDADIVAPTSNLAGSTTRYWATRTVEVATKGQFSLANRCIPTSQNRYELLFVNCGHIGDVFHIGSIKPLVAMAQISVCYISELWRSRFPLARDLLERLRCFDVIFLSCSGTVETLRKATGRPCYYLPPAVDTQLFCPFPESPPRSIDVLSIGRRPSQTHESLMKMADERKDFFYLYDTVHGEAGAKFIHFPSHRKKLANMIMRSKYFIANRPKFDQDKAYNQEEVGYRFFEGAAGGSIMIGDPPTNDRFRELFGWQDAVVPLEYNSPYFDEVFDELEADPDRVGAIRTRNVVNSLCKHDWAHRWASVLERLDMKPRNALQSRVQHLTRLANDFGNGPQLLDKTVANSAVNE